MNYYSYDTRGTCSRCITFALEDGRLHDISFVGGCDGNLRAIGKLLEGTDAARAVELLKGNDCAGRGTSCADQLAIAVEAALGREAAEAEKEEAKPTE